MTINQYKTAYRQHFDKRHGVRPLPDQQQGDSVCVKLEHQKGGNMFGKGHCERSYRQHRKQKIQAKGPRITNQKFFL